MNRNMRFNLFSFFLGSFSITVLEHWTDCNQIGSVIKRSYAFYLFSGACGSIVFATLLLLITLWSLWIEDDDDED